MSKPATLRLFNALSRTASTAAVVLAMVAAPVAVAQCVANWTTHLPSARTEADSVFDTARQRVVLFGGVNGTSYRNDTWENDGNAWSLVASGGPSPRRGHKMVYDTVHRRTLMVGGYGSPALPSFQTWAWDGSTWRMIDSAGPTFSFTTAAAVESAAAFDQARGRVMMFFSNGQTWEFSTTGGGGGWRQAASTGPSARRGMAMVFDRSRNRVLLFGGIAGSTRLNDTWEWDGAQWRAITMIGALPAVRSEARLAWDPAQRRVVLFGGASNGGGRLRDTWVLSGTVWSQLGATAAASPSTGVGSTMVLDSTRDRLMLIGGAVTPWSDICSTSASAPGTWAAVEFGPSARTGAAIAYDTARQRAVLFGGLGSTRLGDTWEFDGANWAPMSDTGPSPRSEHAMGYDPIREQVVLFGGNTGSGAVSGETWIWNAKGWMLASTTGPAPRDRAAMVWEPNLGGLLLHGGAISTGAANNQTWLWNGSSWSQIATGPTRSSHAMAYSPVLDRVVLYGGSGAGVNQVAWAWDGAAWSQIGATGPTTATEHAMIYDPDSTRIVLMGATASDAAVWLFDGQAWQRVANAANTARGRTNLVTWRDETRRRIMIYGGTTSASTRETWEYRGVGGPVVASAPAWQVSCRAGVASFTVQLAAGQTASGVTWLRDGAAISDGPTPWGSMIQSTESADGLTHTISITGVTDNDSGGYQCVLGSDCGGATVTNAAALRICIADFNCSGTGIGDGVSEQDIFDYFTAWFGGDPRADVNRSGAVTVEDIFEFLAAWFASC